MIFVNGVKEDVYTHIPVLYPPWYRQLLHHTFTGLFSPTEMGGAFAIPL